MINGQHLPIGIIIAVAPNGSLTYVIGGSLVTTVGVDTCTIGMSLCTDGSSLHKLTLWDANADNCMTPNRHKTELTDFTSVKQPTSTPPSSIKCG